MKRLFKVVLFLSVLASSSQAFDKWDLFGEWDILSTNNRNVSFGTAYGRKNETLAVIFRKTGQVEIVNDYGPRLYWTVARGDLFLSKYPFEKHGVEKLMGQSDIYRQVRSDSSSGCIDFKIVQKQIGGVYNARDTYRMCSAVRNYRNEDSRTRENNERGYHNEYNDRNYSDRTDRSYTDRNRTYTDKPRTYNDGGYYSEKREKDSRYYNQYRGY